MDDIYEQLFKVVDAGDEKKIVEFLTTHLKRFPQEVQDEILMGLFQEALAKKTQEDATLTEFRKQGERALKQIDRVMELLDRKKRLIEIKKSI